MVQNSIVQTYAEEKNKDVTSQQFLDYIKDLKQKYPNFTFEENTVVYNSLQEAQQVEQNQKQQLEQSIKQYEDTKKQSKDEYGNSYNITGCTSESRVVHVPSKINGRPVKIINPHALSELPNVEAIVLPDSLVSVREDALSNNPKLKYIEFGKSLSVLCEDSMLSLPSLEKVVLPESLEKIDAWVFSGENLKDIYLPSNVKKLSNLFCLSKSCSPDLRVHVKEGSVTAENIKNSDLVAENKVIFE